MRIVLFGDGAWATRTLLRLREAGHETAGVVLRARPTDTGLEQAARACNVAVLQPRNVNDQESIQGVLALGADVNLSIAYDQIFGAALRATAGCFLNVHAGKLPRYRGRNVINWALINGEREIGITVHHVDGGVDTGGIVLQRTLPIEWDDTYGDVLERVQGAIPGIVVETLELIARGEAVSHPQPTGDGTYCPGRCAGDEWLDWVDTSLNLYNKIRALASPGPGARTVLGRDVVTIWRADYEPEWPRYLATPGCVVGRTADGVTVKTGDSTLLVRQVQLGNGQAHVPQWPTGTRLGLDTLQTLYTLTERVAALEQALALRAP